MFLVKEDWDKRKQLGAPRALNSPEELWELACDYFKSVDENAITSEELIKSGPMAGMTVDKKNAAPYLWSGLKDYVFKRIGLTTLKDYKSNRDDRYGNFVPVVEAIRSVMDTQKVSGAAAGLFNPNIIALDVGMARKIELETKQVKKVDMSKLSPEALEELAKQSDLKTE